MDLQMDRVIVSALPENILHSALELMGVVRIANDKDENVKKLSLILFISAICVAHTALAAAERDPKRGAKVCRACAPAMHWSPSSTSPGQALAAFSAAPLEGQRAMCATPPASKRRGSNEAAPVPADGWRA